MIQRNWVEWGGEEEKNRKKKNYGENSKEQEGGSVVTDSHSAFQVQPIVNALVVTDT